MQVEVFADSDEVARQASMLIAVEARLAVSARGQFLLAVSGGKTPWNMLEYLSREELPWQGVHIFQVDERAAPEGHADRNLTQLRRSLEHAPLRPDQIHPMEVESVELSEGARNYQRLLNDVAGDPACLDLIHLGLGADGHTASLVPGDDVLSINDSDVGITDTYQGRQRMTLTYPIINRARRVLWLATGGEKSAMLSHLYQGDTSIPAGRVDRDHALILADRLAWGSQTI